MSSKRKPVPSEMKRAESYRKRLHKGVTFLGVAAADKWCTNPIDWYSQREVDLFLEFSAHDYVERREAINQGFSDNPESRPDNNDIMDMHLYKMLLAYGNLLINVFPNMYTRAMMDRYYTKGTPLYHRNVFQVLQEAYPSLYDTTGPAAVLNDAHLLYYYKWGWHNAVAAAQFSEDEQDFLNRQTRKIAQQLEWHYTQYAIDNMAAEEADLMQNLDYWMNELIVR